MAVKSPQMGICKTLPR